jgi:Concanavalin A-like lectin/glucanases superfamily
MKKSLLVLFGLIVLNSVYYLKANADVAIYVVPPVSDSKILPDTLLPTGLLSKVMNITACKGEFEPGSFVLNPDANVNGLNIQATTLQLHGGTATIPSVNINIRVVKCWYQASYSISNLTNKHLTPELLLKDDSLVNIVGTENYLKLSPDGLPSYYTCISTPASGTGSEILSFDDFPVLDSTTLQAVNLISGENKQFWITVEIPTSATAGIYTADINLSATGVSETIKLTVKVPNIVLADSGLSYSIYYRGKLRDTGTISSEYKNEDQFAVEMQNLINHGVTNPTVYGQGSDSVLGDVLTIRNDEGMDNSKLYYLGLKTDGFATLNELKSAVSSKITFVSSYGVNQLYIYGPDEQNMDTTESRSQITAVHDVNGKVFNAQNPTYAAAVTDILDLVVAAYIPDSELADAYYNNGNEIFSYANPQVGEENPTTYRRNYGISLWQNNYNGAMNYAYHTSFCNIWNDFDHSSYRDHNFTYPTANGVIDTIAWEGFREGVDDVKYISTLTQKISEVMQGSNNNLKAIAKNAQILLDNVQNYENLDELRSKILEYILRLNELPNGTLLAEWKFNDGSGSTSLADSSNNNYNGTLVNIDETSAWVDGKIGKALTVDNNGYVNCGNSNSMYMRDYTITGWIKPSTSGVSGRHIIERGGVANNEGFLLQLWNNDKIYAYQAVDGNFYKVGISTPFPHDSKYHHFAMVFSYDGTNSTLKLYVDGDLKNSRTETGAPDFANSSMLIAYGPFQGEIDEFNIQSKALTGNEVKEIYNSANLRGAWSFNESNGSYISDASTWENAGTLVNLSDALVAGKMSNALELDGSGYLNIGTPDSLNDLVNYTITGWIKPTTSSVSSRHIIERCDVSANIGFLLQFWDNNKIYAYQAVDGNFYKVGISTPFPHDNEYHHFAMVFSYDGINSTLKLYVDGVLKTSSTKTGAPNLPDATSELWLGHGVFQGLLDEFKFYGKAFNDSEVEAQYKNASLCAWWTYDEISETAEIFDYSGNANHGKLVNSDLNNYTAPIGIGGSGLAMEFDGSYIDYEAKDNLYMNNYTIMGWVKPTTSGVTSRQILKRCDVSNNRGLLLQFWDNDKIYAYQAVDDSFYKVGISTPFPHDSEYHHFAMVFNYDGTNSTLKLYVDGVFKISSTKTGAPNLPSSTEQLRMGYGFKGLMDEFKIYNKALGDSEVATEYGRFSP